MLALVLRVEEVVGECGSRTLRLPNTSTRPAASRAARINQPPRVVNRRRPTTIQAPITTITPTLRRWSITRISTSSITISIIMITIIISTIIIIIVSIRALPLPYEMAVAGEVACVVGAVVAVPLTSRRGGDGVVEGEYREYRGPGHRP
uniref:Uncharacterized protein n=1 Tax=Cacopsylla melanoneura TaxID=428564 RepID=A0A8D8LJF1_9HEMI